MTKEGTPNGANNKDQEALINAGFEHQTTLTSYAFVIVKDWSLAQDAVQESFITAYRKWDQFDTTQELLPWLRGIVRFTCLNILKKRKKEKVGLDLELFEVADEAMSGYLETEKAEEAMIQKKLMQNCMNKVKKDDVSIFLKFYVDQISCIDIAEELGKSANAIRLKLSRIRQAIRDCVEKQLAADNNG